MMRLVALEAKFDRAGVGMECTSKDRVIAGEFEGDCATGDLALRRSTKVYKALEISSWENARSP